MLMKNSKDTIGNRSHDLSACSAVPQTTAPLPLTIQEASSRDVNTNLQNKVYNYNYISACHSYLF
jgi:hypothetical protein